MTWDEFSAAIQLLLEERLGTAARAAFDEEDAAFAAARTSLKESDGRTR